MAHYCTEDEEDRYTTVDEDGDRLLEVHIPGSDGRDDCPHAYVCLPHQCDRWVIGGAAEVRALMKDLEQLLPRLVEWEESSGAKSGVSND